MKLWKRARHHVVPTYHNRYRPHLLSRPWLIFFLGLICVLEGFLVSSLVAQPYSTHAISMTNKQTALAAVGAGGPQTFTQGLERQSTRLLDNEAAVNAILLTIGVGLLALIAATFFLHFDVQSGNMLLGAAAVSLVALVCVAANLRFISNSPLQAQVQSAVGDMSVGGNY